MDLLLNLLVDWGAFCFGATGDTGTLLKQLVDLSILVADKVEAAARGVILRTPERIVIRICAQAGPADDHHVIFLAEQFTNQGTKVNRFKGDLEAHRVELILHQDA